MINKSRKYIALNSISKKLQKIQFEYKGRICNAVLLNQKKHSFTCAYQIGKFLIKHTLFFQQVNNFNIII